MQGKLTHPLVPGKAFLELLALRRAKEKVRQVTKGPQILFATHAQAARLFTTKVCKYRNLLETKSVLRIHISLST
jgi:hypothetical protein